MINDFSPTLEHKNSNVRISIVIPSFDRTGLLLETLDSIKSQTSTAWECLVVDDGSPTAHLHTLRKWIADDSRFRVISREGELRGAPVCRNIGWRHATADYIVFLDSDDLLSTRCIQRRVGIIDSNPNLDFFVSATLAFIDTPGDSDTLINTPTKEDPISRFLKMDVIWLSAGVTWKKSTLLRLDGWNEKLTSWQDWDISLRALLQGSCFEYFNEVDNFWRKPNADRESIGNVSFSKEHLESHHKLILDVCSMVSGNAKYLNLATNILFWIAYMKGQSSNLRESLVFWSKAEAFLKRSTYTAHVILLIFLATPLLGKFTKLALKRSDHPAFTLWTGNYLKTQLKEDMTNLL